MRIWVPVLIGTATAKLATKRAAATAIGLNSIFGYLCTALSGVGVGRIVDTNGWDAGFMIFVICSAVGVLLFLARERVSCGLPDGLKQANPQSLFLYRIGSDCRCG